MSIQGTRRKRKNGLEVATLAADGRNLVEEAQLGDPHRKRAVVDVEVVGGLFIGFVVHERIENDISNVAASILTLKSFHGLRLPNGWPARSYGGRCHASTIYGWGLVVNVVSIDKGSLTAILYNMPEPSKGRDGLRIPDDFDPLKHCGAKLRNKDTVCMRPVGAGTDYPGDPAVRCRLHGGLTPIKTDGLESKVVGRRRGKLFRASLADEIEAMRHSPELLALDEHIATLKAVIRRKVEMTSESYERYEEYLDKVHEAAETSGIMPDPVMVPSLPMEEITLLSKLVAAEYEMRFSKRFSVPLPEVQAMIARIGQAFNEVAKQYGISDAARMAFAQKITNLKISKMPEDPQLLRAGQGPIVDTPALKDAVSGEYISGGEDAAG